MNAQFIQEVVLYYEMKIATGCKTVLNSANDVDDKTRLLLAYGSASAPLADAQQNLPCCAN
jgi:hypothetical protein